ncbi:MAG: primosomal protein N', partial [Bacteroidetes bacterium]|nr:primosomal protein N' [Bacteroidota bacterium]
DEEHDASYKQFDPAPRYNARDCSIYLAGIHKAKVLLGTATPSIESSYNAYGEKYGLVKLDKRYGGFDLPEMVIADKKKDVQTRFKHSHFTSSLIEELQATRKNAEQSILFQNRRGYVPYMECNQCGWIPNCIRCDVSLTYHKYTDNLRCHYCGYSIKMVTSCPSCTSTNISIHGFGTELIEEELNQLLPGISVSRMDWDTTRSKHGHEKIISSFESGSIDVLVGTQMVTKSLDFDNVTLVGILSAENLFNFPDFRANERAFQMISQVSGRAGRKSKKGKVIIQTFDAKNPLLQMIMKNDYEAFYKGEINQRKLFKYPPFYRLIKFSIKHETKFKTEQAANHLAALLKKIGKIEMLGPEFPPIPRIRNKYIKNILVKMHPAKKSLSKLKSEIRTQLEGFHSNQNFKSVLVHIDVDPLD